MLTLLMENYIYTTYIWDNPYFDIHDTIYSFNLSLKAR